MKRSRSVEEEEDGDEGAILVIAPPCQATGCFELRYFDLFAKGLGPSLVAEHSGLPWAGNKSLGFSISKDWAELKARTPFGQLPLLSVPGRDFQLGQTTAIINYIGKMAGTEGRDPDWFALSQQLLAEAEDIYMLMNQFLPTLYKKLTSEEASPSKGTNEDYALFWAEKLPAQLKRLEEIGHSCSGTFIVSIFPPGLRGRDMSVLPGELHLFAMLYQAWIIHTEVFSGYPKLGKWFDWIKANPCTQKVLKGESPMGNLKQYYLSIDSPDICSLGDERGRCPYMSERLRRVGKTL